MDDSGEHIGIAASGHRLEHVSTDDFAALQQAGCHQWLARTLDHVG